MDELRRQRIGKAPRGGDRIEILGNAGQRVELDQRSRFQLALDDDRREHGQPRALPRQKTHHRHVLHLRRDLRRHVKPRHKRIELLANPAFPRGQDDRIKGKPRREARFALGRTGPPDQAHPLRRDQMGDERRRRIGSGGLVQQHDIEVQAFEPAEQIRHAARTQDHLHIRPRNGRPQEFHLEIARQGGERTDADRAPGHARALQRFDELLARGKDPVRMVERDPPRLGQDELPPAPLEERMAEPLFELLDLDGERRLRKVQPFGGARQVAVMGDGAEIAQVVIVHLAHTFYFIE